MDPEIANLPRLRRSQYRQTNHPEQTTGNENDPSSSKNPRSSRIKKLMRNSGEKKTQRHYPGSTPLHDNFDLNNPPTQKNFEYSFDPTKQECQARLLPPKMSKRPKRWRHLLEKKPTNKCQQSTKVEFNSDAFDDIINEKGTMVFSSEDEENRKTKEERKREERERQERKQKEEEREQLRRERENAMKELEMKRAKEAEKEAKRELEEERKLCERQLQILRDNAIISEDPRDKTETIQERMEKSRKKK